MSRQRDSIAAMRQDLLKSLEDLREEMDIDHGFILYRSDLIEILGNLAQILSEDKPNQKRLEVSAYAIFRMVTDNDFQHTALGKRFLEFTDKLGRFIRNIS